MLNKDGQMKTVPELAKSEDAKITVFVIPVLYLSIDVIDRKAKWK